MLLTPLVVYDFSRGRSRDAPIAFLKGFRGYLQADAFPGYDVLYDRDVQEVGVFCSRAPQICRGHGADEAAW